MHESDLSNNIDIGDPFGMIRCPQCNMSWLKEFVPEYCTECSTKVANQPGKGMADSVRMIRLAKIPVNIIQCPNCKLEYPQTKERPIKKCYRCNHTLINASPLRNISRKVVFKNRFLFKFFWRFDRIRGLHKPKC